jgi:multiple sugar transport system substrate-binding protein
LIFVDRTAKGATDMRSRSLLPGIVAVILSATALAGCGQSELDSAGGRVTLTWWDYFDYSPNASQAVTRLLEKYQAAYPEIQVKRTVFRFADFPAKLTEAAATGNFPDVAAIDNADVPVFAAQGALADLTSRMRAWQGRVTFLDPVQRSIQVGDKAYGIPFRSNTTALWYNKNLFAAAGLAKPPATWDELRADAARLTTDAHAGFCFSAAPTEEGTFTLLPLIWQAGGDASTIGDQPSIDALSFVNTLVNEDRSAPKSVLQWGQSEVGTQFAAGHCAMMINGPWVLHSVTKAGFDFGVAPWPAGRHGTAAPLGGEVLAVGKHSKHLDAAWQLTTWLSDPANSLGEVYRGLCGIPNRTSTIDDPAWAWHPAITTFAQQLRTAHPRGAYGPKYPQLSQVISTMQQEVLTNQENPATAAAEASQRIKSLLTG